MQKNQLLVSISVAGVLQASSSSAKTYYIVTPKWISTKFNCLTWTYYV